MGAIVVDDGRALGWGGNAKAADPTAHAELQAIRMAAATRGGWNLSGCTLYVTLEPCPMCAGACVNARVSRVVFGARDPRAGAGGSLYDILRDTRLNHRSEVRVASWKTSAFACFRPTFWSAVDGGARLPSRRRGVGRNKIAVFRGGPATRGAIAPGA